MCEELLDLNDLQSTYCGRGTPPHRPDLLLKLLIYEHCSGRMQPVQWLKDLRENKPVQWLTFGIKPSRTTLYEFRDRVQPLLAAWNIQVIRKAIEEGHTDGSCGALDGTTVAANASRHRLLKLDTVKERLAILDQEIAEEEALDGAAPVVDTQPPDPPVVDTQPPDPPASSEQSRVPKLSWKAKTLRGKKRQRAHYRRARAVLQEKVQANRRRRKDKRKEVGKIRLAIGDPMAPFGLDKTKVYRPLYTVQTMSDVATDLVFAYATTRSTTDSGQLLPMIDRTMEATNRPFNTVLVDSAYPSGEDLARCHEKAVTVYGPWKENSFTKAKRAKSAKKQQIPKDQFEFDSSLGIYRCPQGKPLEYHSRTRKQRASGEYFGLEIYQAKPSDCAVCPVKAGCVRGGSGARTVRRQEHEEQIEALKARMKEPEAKELYSQRGCSVERRFADVKTHQGLHRFSGRTPERADAQVGLTMLAHNLRTLDKVRMRRRQHAENTEKMPA